VTSTGKKHVLAWTGEQQQMPTANRKHGWSDLAASATINDPGHKGNNHSSHSYGKKFH